MNWQLLAALFLGLVIGVTIAYRSPKTEDKLRPEKPVTQNILDYTATIGLILGMLYWGTYYYLVIVPSAMTYPVNIAMWLVTILLGICHTMAGPLLVSLTLPQDPVNQLLSDQKKHTWGFMLQIAATTVMAGVSFKMTYSFFNSIPAVRETTHAFWLTIAVVIFTIVIPNLAWQKAVPLNWQWQVQQAFAIELLRKKHGAELMRMNAEHIRQISHILVDTAQHTVDQVPGIAKDYTKFMRGMFGRMNAEMKGIGHLVGALARADGVRVPGMDMGSTAVKQDLLLLEDTMKRGLALEVVEDDAVVPARGHENVR